MVNNLIQWPTAKYWTAQWNPVIGCKPCSPACENCYAASWAKRFGQSFEPHQSSRARPPRKGIVFCGNMTDLFGEWRDWQSSGTDIHACFSSDANDRDKAKYLWLTKRVGRMAHAINYAFQRTFWPSCDLPVLCGNHYFGFTAENQDWYDRRFDSIVPTWPNWAKIWVSCEPLLGPINLQLYPGTFDWVVVGCESGPNRRPCKIEWVESIVEQCLAAGVPVFVKQLDINGRCETDINRFPAHLRIRQVPWAKEEV